MTTRAGRRGSVPGSRASFVLRRTRFAPLVPASLLLAVLTSVTVTTALASFGARALPTAAHKRLADSPATTILVSGQIGAARARADLHVIRAAQAWSAHRRGAARSHRGHAPLLGRAAAGPARQPDRSPGPAARDRPVPA